MNNNKIEELLKNSSTFSGLDIPSYDQDTFKEIVSFEKKNNNELNYENNFIPIQEKGSNEIEYLAKNFTGTGKSKSDSFIGDVGEAMEDIESVFSSKYQARGVKFSEITTKDVETLKDTFGIMVSCVKSEADPKKHDAFLFTHIEKKETLEKVVDRTFDGIGIAVGWTSALLGALTAGIFSNPISGFAFFQLGVTTAAGAAGTGAAALGFFAIPKVLDVVRDKFNGDEREFALEFFKNKISLENKGKDISFEDSFKLTLDTDDIVTKIGQVRSNSVKTKGLTSQNKLVL